MRTLLKYLGPYSPWGPAVSRLMFGTTVASLISAIVFAVSKWLL